MHMQPSGISQPKPGANYRLQVYTAAPKNQCKRRPTISLGTKDETTARLIAIAVKRALQIAGYCSSGITMPRGRPKKKS
jgi:hypothetical protein